jgi:ribosome maturation factor RimP
LKKPPLIRKIENIVGPMAESMGYELVRVLMVGAGSGRPTLQIMAERPDGTMQIEDCSRLSQAASALLDVENAIEEAYYLEVSSPGIDRPLTRFKDFARYKDHEIRVELDTPMNGQKKFKGMLKGTQGADGIVLETEGGDTVTLPFSDVDRAKLVLTDDLLRAAMKADKEREKAEKAERRQAREEKKLNRNKTKTGSK